MATKTDKMGPLIFNSASIKSGEVLLCLGCLATDCRLYDLREEPLKQDLEQIAGTFPLVSGGSMCSLCVQQLRKCLLFRNRCLNINSILTQIQEAVEDTVVNIDRPNLKNNLQISGVTIIDITPSTDIIQKIKHFVRTETLVINIDSVNEIDLTVDNDAMTPVTNQENVENPLTVFDNDPDENNISEEDDFLWPIDKEDDDFNIEEEQTKKTIKIESKEMSKKKIEDNYSWVLKEEDDIKEKPRKKVKKESKCTKQKNIKKKSATNDGPNVITEFLVLHREGSNLGNASATNDDNEPVNEIDESDIEHIRKSKLLYRIFVSIWREAIKNKGDLHDVFMGIYKISFTKFRPKMPKNVLRKKGLHEAVKIMKFVDLHKELADFYNVDIKFINIEEERMALDEKRETIAKEDKDENCKMCCKKFRKQDALQRHLHHKHNEKFVYRCKVCLYTFRRQCLLAAHLLKSHAMQVRCKDCQLLLNVSIASNWMTEAKSHKALHLGHLSTCEFCGRTFTARKLYYMHIRAVHRANIDAMTCVLCGDSYNGPAGLRSHIHRMHPQALQCEMCSVKFLNEDVLKAHNATGEDCQSLSACGRCGANFPSERAVSEHYDEVHASCKCDVCKRPYYGKQNYKEHLKVCKGSPFSGKRRRRRPMCEGDGRQKRGGGARPLGEYVCEVCGAGFKTAGRLAPHLKKHEAGDRPHICDLCGKAFRLKLTLKTHMFVHTGERPYKCTLCPKSFRQLPHLKAHMPFRRIASIRICQKATVCVGCKHYFQRSHTLEKAFECHICKKRFTNKSNRLAHVKTVHEGLPARKKKRPL